MAFEELLETRNQGDIAVVKSLLESEGIPCFVHGEQFNTQLPFGGAARIMVPDDRLAEARDLISGLSLSISTFGTFAEQGDADGD